MDRDEAIDKAFKDALTYTNAMIQSRDGKATVAEIDAWDREGFLASLAASGFAVVPKEATEPMILAAAGDLFCADQDAPRETAMDIWKSMLSAARSEKECATASGSESARIHPPQSQPPRS